MGKKLSVKIFFAFLAVSIASVSMLAIADRFYANKNFDSYLRYNDIESLKLFSETIARLYDGSRGWRSFEENPAIWDSVIDEKWPKDITSEQAGEDNIEDGIRFETINNASSDILPYSAIIPEEGSHPNLILFDSDKNRIAGSLTDSDDVYKRAVICDGKIVGWVGITLGYKILHPLDQSYLKIKPKIFRTLDITVLGISLVISFLLTRYLLSPIRSLIDASEALGERNFDIRTPVTSRDELGVLAMRFNAMAEKLKMYEQNQKQWLADISHELRSPLAVLMGEIESFQDGLRKPDRASLASLYGNAKFLSKIIEELHYLSLSDAGYLNMLTNPVKLLPILSQAIFLYKNRLESSGMTLDIRLNQTDADVEIMGDYDRLMHLFGNLLENVIVHATKPGILTIHQTRTPEQIHIIIEDSGPGVSDEALNRLFDRLYRTDASRSRKTGGSGLGLSICKAIVEGHDGTILARNSEKGGLKIEIHFPAILLCKNQLPSL